MIGGGSTAGGTMVYLVWLVLLCGVVVRCGAMDKEVVELDLQHGIVRGFSQYITFIEDPKPRARASTSARQCAKQAVVKIDFSGPFTSARFQLRYDLPRMWTLDISDSPFGDGYGGDNGTTSNMAEAHVYNKQLRIYGNNLPGHLDHAIDGGLLLKVVDNFVKKGQDATIDVSDERVDWTQKGKRSHIESKFLFTLSGQNTTYGNTEYSVYAAFNRVIAGRYRQGSGLCRVIITLLKGREDECQQGRNQCHRDARCLNTRKSFRCRCKPGFYGTGKICVDMNECEDGDCVHTCTNTNGNYTCSCMTGFQQDRDGHNCIDKNECFLNKGGCQHQCINTIGSFECRCNAGYSLQPDGQTCSLGTYCQDRLHCAHHCTSTRGSGTTCACRTGYRLHSNNRDCIVTCAAGNGGCQHKCADGTNGVTCSCHPKYRLSTDRRTCIATCNVSNGGCDRRCEDSERGPVCSCPPGYILHQDGKTCLDVDECKNVNGGCSHDCVNTHGSYECICPKGFRVEEDEKTCVDFDECYVNTTCDHVCLNLPGHFRCGCRRGYQSYGLTHCADKNECFDNNGGCQHVCRNMDGGFECSCRAGYRIHTNKKDCVEAVRCQTLVAPPKTSFACQNLGNKRRCTLSCLGNAQFTSSSATNYVYECGADTSFMWSFESANETLPPCSDAISAPSIKRKGLFVFIADQCKARKRSLKDFQYNLNHLIVGTDRYRCTDACTVDNVRILCGSKRRKFRQVAKTRRQEIVTAEFDLVVAPRAPPADGRLIPARCDVNCVRQRTIKFLKRATKRLRREINKGQFRVRYDGIDYTVEGRSMKLFRTTDMCAPGTILANNKCVGCGLGTFYKEPGVCELCPPGTYQDREGKAECKDCPHNTPGVGTPGASRVSQCEGQCLPGTYSENGFQPCTRCARGTYQPDHGRASCQPCGDRVTTRSTGSTGFHQCQVTVKCPAGQFWSRTGGKCEVCPRNHYQTLEGQDHCLLCPGNTSTDGTGAINSTQCKDRKCGGHIGQFQGFIQSPNWPGDYPADVECTWSITREKGRRILIVIPEIFLASQDRCGDILSMRKSESPYSLTTYETCESTETPIAFTARSKRLYIQFKTNGRNSAAGFSIPYVTYNEEYQELIEDIVRDSRLYSTHQHQEVLKDRKLLAALLEVIAQPYNYFNYANQSRSMFPESFIRLLTSKVRRFFD